MTELSELQKQEIMALVLKRHAIISVVSALRQYRSATDMLSKNLYNDYGEIDNEVLNKFYYILETIENLNYLGE